jgi:uncharacterized protein (DUF1499 family)
MPLFGKANLPEPHTGNPLKACPDSPNCVRTTESFSQTPGEVNTAVGRALERMGAEKTKETGEFTREAVFRIPVFGWRDDVSIAIGKADDGKTLLHIRSASRTGYSDFGVNSRRVSRLLRLVKEELA